MKIKKNLSNMVPYKPGILKPGALKLSSNENRLGPSPKAIEAITRNIGNINIYPDGSCRNLKKSLGKKYNYKEENFIIGNGSDEILTLIAAAYISEGDNAVTSECTFSEYTFATKLYSGEMVKTPLRDGSFNPDNIISNINKKTKVVYICNPNNPTGTYLNHEELDNLISRVPESTLFVLDEAYADYSDALDFPDSHKLFDKYKNLIILRTFSKIYGISALRVGYGIAKEEIINDILKAKQPFNVNTPAQIGAEAALSDTDFYQKSIEMNSTGKRFLYRELDRLNLEYYQSQANFICIHVKQDSKILFEKMMNQGVTIRPLTSFGLYDWIRVTIGTENDNLLFIRILENSLE